MQGKPIKWCSLYQTNSQMSSAHQKQISQTTSLHPISFARICPAWLMGLAEAGSATNRALYELLFRRYCTFNKYSYISFLNAMFSDCNIQLRVCEHARVLVRLLVPLIPKQHIGMTTGPSPTGITRTLSSPREENLHVLIPVPARGEGIFPVPERGSCTSRGPQPRLVPEELEYGRRKSLTGGVQRRL
jgi:hypothetical protein